jgi:hypothetical protein
MLDVTKIIVFGRDSDSGSRRRKEVTPQTKSDVQVPAQDLGLRRKKVCMY